MTIDFTNVMKNKTDYLTPEEIDRMLNYCISIGSFQWYAFILTLYRTGRRISEIVGQKPYINYTGFRPCDIHPEGLIEFDILKKNHVKRKTKSGQLRSDEAMLKMRLAKTPKRALKAVDPEYIRIIKMYIQHKRIGEYERVFPITRQWGGKIIRKISKGAKVLRGNKFIHPHSFRHSFSINILKKRPNDAGVLRQLQQLLDHSNINITMEYANFTQDDKKKMLSEVFNE